MQDDISFDILDIMFCKPPENLGVPTLQAPINSSIFTYLNLIKSIRSNYEIRIIIIIIEVRSLKNLNPEGHNQTI